MKSNSKLVKAIKLFYQNLYNQSNSTIKSQRLWLLRSFLITNKRAESLNAGFVLPTVAMVSLVVVLLTVAILFRSFERSKNASNVRINEAVLNAASPSLERAKAKVDQLFKDPRLPRSTPSDFSLSQVIADNINQFTFGDETQLKLVREFNGSTNIQDEETLKTAWKYPTDTDNNGKFDTYTLYGIYFRTPTTDRPRGPLEARAQPMDEGAVGNRCSSPIATSANLVGTQGWYKVGSKLKRSIFVYSTNVPITEIAGLDANKYEKFNGSKGFVALEYQQDRERVPLNNNAVLYENDLEVAPGFGININGRIFTNGNLLTRKSGFDIRFYLVSSPKSCYYTEENSKVLVAGNVINSRISESSDGSAVQVDLFDKSYDVNAANLTIAQGEISSTNKTVPSNVYGTTAAFNDEAYFKRLDRLVAATNASYPNNSDLPDEVQQEIRRSTSSDATLSQAQARNEQLRIYFKKRTRRVPYAEIPVGGNAVTYTVNSENYDFETNSPLTGSGNSLRPVDVWVFPFDPANGTDASKHANIGIKEVSGGNKIYLPATDPAIQTTEGKESRLGDRVLVGNNLPQYWYDTTRNKFVSSETGQPISGKEWDNNTNPRQRFTQAYQLDDLGNTERDGFWEKSATQQPQGPLDVVGGLRVITGAGIYLPNDYDPSNRTFTNSQKVVWSDSMPMGVRTQAQGLPQNETPYLQMRTTVVYHYQDDPYDPKAPTNYQTPIACVSSYYDPTNETTAINQDGLIDVRQRATTPVSSRALALTTTVAAGTEGKSNNGVVYDPGTLSVTTYRTVLDYQAQLKYPNGRLVNEQLKKALARIDAAESLTLSEQSAIDSAICSLKILDGSIGSPTDTAIPHGAIMETAFLDPRQIQAIDKPSSSRAYDLDVELRQPLEIRATILDLDLIRRKSKNSGEFLLPNSGIIYATRDDALPDDSEPNNRDVSSTDFKLDPTRKPNGILLINGSDLSRNSVYKPEEKGLILATNLPTYIRGNFNVHTQEEFTDILLKTAASWGTDFYKRKALNPQFACRKNQFSSCDTGETWRPASVIADSITILSGNFRFGFRQEGDYDLRDNYGYHPIGYDVDGSGGSLGTTQISLNEAAIRYDLNNNGNIDGDVNTLNETSIGVDIDGDGLKTNTSVPITESNITATIAARLNGFWDNNFVTSRQFTDTDYSTNPTTPPAGSSYFNNFVTPIQRRVTFSEYVMEVCPKLTVTACQPNDWVVGYDLNGDTSFSNTEQNIKANDLVKALSDASITSIQTTRLWAGTTATPAKDQRYPRRIAFLRYRSGLTATNSGTSIIPVSPVNNALILDSDKTPVPLGIFDNSGNLEVRYFPFSNTLKIDARDYSPHSNTNQPRTQSNSLWFKTYNKDGSPKDSYNFQYPLWIENLSTLTGTRATEQPILAPVLQIHYPLTTNTDTDDSITLTGDEDARKYGNWMQTATETETNLVFAQGDTPGRPTESNGGLENFVRYIERWQNGPNDTDLIKHIASGAFIQMKRSAYATAPFLTLTSNFDNPTILRNRQGYRLTVNQIGTLGRTSFYAAPRRFWGYDVALLTQLPDLFSQRFSAPSVGAPNEFYREVGRDDNWVKTLLCAAQKDTGYDDAPTTYGTDFKYALSPDQRPQDLCPKP
ncbi:hormogonium polysaccharide biosynthesis protein HpsA [Scytonema sp. NUACC21]